MTVTHLFFDVGGVLGSAGWGTSDRALGARQFGLDASDFEKRHHEVVGMWETGVITMDEYLDHTVFHVSRQFSRDAFRAFVFERSVPHHDTIRLAEALAVTNCYRLYTLNNESVELNVHRIRSFGLGRAFDGFFSSCWLGIAKPARAAYERALAFAQADPARAVFVDDRAENLEPARALGMHTIRFTSATDLRDALAAAGVTF